MKKIKILGLFLVLALFLQNMVFAADLLAAAKTSTSVKKNKKLDAQVETRRVPKGTKLKVKLLDSISTKYASEGEMFSSMLITDTSVDNAMILPSGTIIRGYVEKVKKAKLASIGAVLYLKFDHIVTPSGTQLPIKSAFSYNNDSVGKITLDGGLRKQAGYGDALKENWNNTKNIVSKSTHWGLDMDNAAAKVLLTPVGAIGGTLGGGLYLMGDSVVDIFKMGKQVILNKDDIVEIIILKDLDVPVI